MPRSLLCLLLIAPSLWAQSTVDNMVTPTPPTIWLQLEVGAAKMYGPDVQSQEEPLTKGLELQGALGFHISDQVALGGIFNRYSSSNSYNTTVLLGYDYYGNPQTTTASAKDDLSIKFFGPALFFRNLNNSRSAAFVGFISGGYVDYNDDGTVQANGQTISGKITGNTFGLLTGIGGEIYLGPSAAIGVECRSLTATISSRTLEMAGNSVTNTEKASLSRISINAGLHLAL